MGTRVTLMLAAVIVTFAGVAVVTVAAALVERARGRQNPIAAAPLMAYGLALAVRPPYWGLADAAVIAGAVGGVVLIARGLTSPATVVAFLFVAAAVDLASWSGGPTRRIIDAYREGRSALLLFLALSIPLNGRIVPIVGIGDLLVGGSASLALVRAGFRPPFVALAVATGLLGALAYGLWRGGAPAVPFIAATVAGLVSWRARRTRTPAATP